MSWRLIPNEKGIKLFAKIEPIFDQLTELDRFTTALRNAQGGHLRFAMTPAFGLEVGPVALARFSKQNPDITIETETLHANQVVKALLDDAIDMGLVFDAPTYPGVETQRIGQIGFVCIAPEEMKLTRSKSLKIEDMKDMPLITLNQKSVLGKILNRRLEDAFMRPIESQIVVETYHLAKRLVKQNTGIAVIDAITALSGDVTGLTIQKIAPFIPINIDIVTRLNAPEKTFYAPFIHELGKAIEDFQKSSAYLKVVN